MLRMHTVLGGPGLGWPRETSGGYQEGGTLSRSLLGSLVSSDFTRIFTA